MGVIEEYNFIVTGEIQYTYLVTSFTSIIPYCNVFKDSYKYKRIKFFVSVQKKAIPNFSSGTFSTVIGTGEIAIDVSNNNKQIRTYAKRWYILAVITSYVTIQYFTWNTFGPIASSVKELYNWNNSDIALLANWDTILYVIFSLQICWFVQKSGIE